jgi:endonuclease YncB( thermonuclease family)
VDIDRYGRTVATVYLDDGRELNLEIIRAGYAWNYRKYSNRQDYAEAEENARAEKLGLWTDPHAKPPWEWVRDRRRKSWGKVVTTEIVFTGTRVSHLLACRRLF